MPDLYIDLDALARTKTTLEHMGSLMRDPLATMTSRAGAATEVDVLRSRMQEFADAWDYGIDKLGRYTADCGDLLDRIGSTFLELDGKIAAALEQGK